MIRNLRFKIIVIAIICAASCSCTKARWNLHKLTLTIITLNLKSPKRSIVLSNYIIAILTMT